MSTHTVNVIEIADVLPHPNAERLEIVPVNGWQAVVKKGQFKPGDRAIYIEPDYTVPTGRPEFSFLSREGRERHRLKAIRLRGALSFGLLIPVPDDLQSHSVGDNVMVELGIERYEPPIKLAGSDELSESEWPAVYASKFDVENFNRFPTIIRPGEPVIVTEKIHGANARYLFSGGVFYMGSRTRWLKPDVQHEWRYAVDGDASIRKWCEAHTDIVLYGEIYGAVQSLKYGSPRNVRFAAFAASYKGEWIDTGKLLDDSGLPTVPCLYRGEFDIDFIKALAEQDSTVPGAEVGHIREGVVIVPERERRNEEIGRVALKIISNRYWESAA